MLKYKLSIFEIAPTQMARKSNKDILTQASLVGSFRKDLEGGSIKFPNQHKIPPSKSEREKERLKLCFQKLK